MTFVITQPLLGLHRAPWGGSAAASSRARPPVGGAEHADVVVVGGGVVGVTAAIDLLARSHSVVLLEADRIGCGSTGRSTGKVSSQHGMAYADLTRMHGAAVARAYGQRNQAAVERVVSLANEYDIACRLEMGSSYLHTDDARHVRALRREAEAALAAGLPATFVDTAPLPHPVRAAVRFDGQVVLDPLRYVRGLADGVEQAGGRIREQTRVRTVRRTSAGLRVVTDGGEVHAQWVVIATLAPTVDPVLSFARMEAKRTYGIAAEVRGAVSAEPAINVGSPTRSTRRVVDDDGSELLVVVGGSHETGARSADPRRALDGLIEHADRHWGVTRVRYHWSAQDMMSLDQLPIVGRTRLHPRLLVATGMRKWGLTNGTAAAAALADLVDGRDEPSPFAAGRLPTARVWPAIARANVTNGFEVLRGRRPGRQTTATPPAGKGIVVPRPTGPVAISTTTAGRTCAVSATCTHLGCTVRWNGYEQSWDCPCHGSRFAPDGRALVGPGDRQLRPADDPTQ